MSTPGPAAVVGGGSWGTALAKVLASKGQAVRLWVRDPDLARTIERCRENPRYLAGVRLDGPIRATSDLEDALTGTSLVVSALPSHVVRSVIAEAAPHITQEAIIVSASKGIEEGSLKRMTEVLGDVLGRGSASRLAVLSGPSFAAEVCRGAPTAVTVAAEDPEVADAVREAFFASRFRVYTSDDVVGVELGGAVKNVVAIATGIADGLEYGHNARAALITRGLAEISRLGTALGGQRLTFMGLAGLGDLVLTCTSELSRNRTVGLRLGRGEVLETILAEMRQVAEGVRSTRSVRDLAARIEVEMPIVEQVYEMLYHAKSPQVVVEELMTRESKPEFQQSP
ncbi:MAG TPA: NAD(P)H-dependent glycerol-3-phosphate dehydrogenase [Gemmatimonadota bacterium]|nr:NAD(P)H-dependent glycerol-3-phosphate dehydrogenase [Gemmatimonadota bacterium]